MHPSNPYDIIYDGNAQELSYNQYMNKYLFEKYEFSNRGTEFKGYVPVMAENTQQATLCAQSIAGDHIKLQQVYINPHDDYAR